MDPYMEAISLLLFLKRIILSLWFSFKNYFHPIPNKQLPLLVSVNFHFTRKCNYTCGFCFHTAKTSHLTPVEDAQHGLQKLADKGMRKLNFSGGEPFLESEYLGKLCQFAKEVLQLESVSIVSNGSLIKRQFFQKYARFLDILAISVDSFDEATNEKIGRGKGRHLEKLWEIADFCSEFNVKFKLNTVVNRYNHMEDFTQEIQGLNPCRWKCFQVLPVETENTGDGARRNVDEFLISDEEFEAFCVRHKGLDCFVPESNRNMKSSYVILDEYMRFLNKGDKYDQSKSILEVSVEEAIQNIDFEQEVFLERGGFYPGTWTKDGGGCKMDPKLEF